MRQVVTRERHYDCGVLLTSEVLDEIPWIWSRSSRWTARRRFASRFHLPLHPKHDAFVFATPTGVAIDQANF